jgi:hypothetical protein
MKGLKDAIDLVTETFFKQFVFQYLQLAVNDFTVLLHITAGGLPVIALHHRHTFASIPTFVWNICGSHCM